MTRTSIRLASTIAAALALLLPQRVPAAADAIDPQLLQELGIARSSGTDAARLSRQLARRHHGQSEAATQAIASPFAVGLPTNMNGRAALSAAVMTTVAGPFNSVVLMGDWDGQEDLTADHSAKVDDFSSMLPDPSDVLTRTAISEHTIANGFAENVFYYGDSIGNVFVGVDTTGDAIVDSVLPINLPTVLNAFGTLNSDDQIVITGLGVNPVADLTSFANVNGSYASFNGLVGEILYVSFWDTGGGLRLLANGTLVRSGVLAFPIADIVSAAAAPPGIISAAGFPVQVGGAFGVAFSVFSNMAGLAVDDDGNVYFQQVDLIGRTGGNIVKLTGVDEPGIPGVAVGFQDRSLATNGFFTLSTLNPINGQYGTVSGPAKQVTVATNYSGTANTFGNIAALAAGPGNALYAAVSRSLVTTDSRARKAGEGLFTNPAALGATPSMIISFADAVGSFAPCSLPQNPVTMQYVPGAIGLPIGNGIADVAQAGLVLTPGVNNFRAFALGTGPDRRGSNPAVFGTTANTLKMPFKIDYTIYAGLTVDEANNVYVVSGGTPAGVGRNPSGKRGEILLFPDHKPMDRRADYVDLRGNTPPNPPANGGTTGDGDSDRFDHIFFRAPVDQTTASPAGIAGLARGFLMYTNRKRPAPVGSCVAAVCSNTGVPCVADADCFFFPKLPNGGTQGDDTNNGPNLFNEFDPSRQVSGGDDQVFPFTGDDDDGAGNPPVPGPLNGGFEFLFANPLGDVFQVGAACGTGNGVWNAFFLNSNGNITFGVGSDLNIANLPAFRSGPPRIAGAWADLNPGSRASLFVNTFPVQALGFAGINDFKVRFIDVPEFGFEACGSSNTFATSLFDDGTGIDENANQPLNPANPIGNNAVPFDLQEGRTVPRWVKANTSVIVSEPLRPDGTGQFWLDYARMDLLGTNSNPVLAGFSIGNQNPLNPPGLCPIDLSLSARAADSDPFRPSLLGEGTEPTIFEFFSGGHGPTVGPGGEIDLAESHFDLRFEGNDPALAQAIQGADQPDLNRQHVGFFGTTCQLPPNPLCVAVFPYEFVAVAPGQPAVGTAAAATPNGLGQKIANPTAGIVNALCEFTLDIVGSGFAPNESTLICQGGNTQRPGKLVTTAEALHIDTNGDGIPDTSIVLTNVTPISRNLIRGTLVDINGLATAFPLNYCGGLANLTTTTTFTAGNNNIFNLLAGGGFIRSTTCVIDTGQRAPIITSVVPSGGVCGGVENLDVDGACFIYPNGTPNVTGLTATNAESVDASNFVLLDAHGLSATFNFGVQNPGTEFSLFATGPNGTSRNLSSLPAGAPAGCPLGSELGSRVTYTCQ